MNIRKVMMNDIINNAERIKEYFFDLFKDADTKKRIQKSKEKYINMYKFISNGSANVFGAFSEEKIIGFIWFYKIKEDTFHINYFYVSEKNRNNGIGQKLLEKVYEEAKKQNIKNIELLVDINNIKAKEKYEKNGFQGQKIKMNKIL